MYGQARIARVAAMMCAVCSFICITVLVLLTCPSAYRSAVPRPETLERREREADQLQQLGASALNTASAFEPYRDPASRTATEPDVQQQHQHNILFSPSCLGSALAQLCPVSGSDSQSRPWRPRGWWPTRQNTTCRPPYLLSQICNAASSSGGRERRWASEGNVWGRSQDRCWDWWCHSRSGKLELRQMTVQKKELGTPHEVMLKVEETKAKEGGRPDTMLDFSVPP
ncbi:uncharacterized protein LOC116321042 [Oreochromis aureus]|uniref:uncharacterized protein LOC116321042 n=1 Tax=Oreochromis aureus TaxID=47969 RepID=UPI0012BBF50D|nr:uncharacterized protein LOC116321042 [Oreochromis aureus]